MYTLVLVSGVAVGWGRKRLFAVAICASLPSLVMRRATWVWPGVVDPVWSDISSLIAIIVITYVLLAQVFREGPINLMRVLGAVAAYLLLGDGLRNRVSDRFSDQSVGDSVKRGGDQVFS